MNVLNVGTPFKIWFSILEKGVPKGILDFLLICIVAAALLGFISVTVMFLIWLERKISGHIQTRFGPMRVGWHGWLQPIADTIKLLLKENIVPAGADRIIYFLAPVVVF